MSDQKWVKIFPNLVVAVHPAFCKCILNVIIFFKSSFIFGKPLRWNKIYYIKGLIGFQLNFIIHSNYQIKLSIIMVLRFGRWWRRTEHWNHAHPGMVPKLGARGHAKHQKHAQMAIVLRFSRWGGGGDTLNIKNMRIWAWLWCLAGKNVVDTQTLKLCPDGHNFDVQRVRRWCIHAEHWKHAQVGMISMFRMVDRLRTLKPCLSHFFDVRWVGMWTE